MVAVGVLLILLSIAAWTDARSHTIYNWNCYPGIIAGLVINSAGLGSSAPGMDGFVFAAAGFLACGFIMLTAFVFFQMGGGDVKLLANLFQRVVGVHVDAETHTKHLCFPWRQSGQHSLHRPGEAGTGGGINR